MKILDDLILILILANIYTVTADPTGSNNTRQNGSSDVIVAMTTDTRSTTNNPATASTLSATVYNDESTVPRRPTWMRLRLTPQGIVVTWASPNGSPSAKIRGYIVGFGVGIPDVFRQIISDDLRSYTIKNIKAASEYVVSLRAFNLAGEGVPVYETITTITEQDSFEATVPLFPPLGLKAVVLSSTSVWLSWVDAPDTNPRSTKNSYEGKIYVARWTAKGKKAYTLQNVTAKSLLVEDLRPSTEYEFSVKVVKPKVASAWSLGAFNKTFDTVMTLYPRDLTVTSSEEDGDWIIISWQPPKNHGGQITGYQLCYANAFSETSQSPWVEQNLRGDRLSATLRSSTLSTTLLVKIRAKNNAGYGPFSPVVVHKGKSNYEIIDLDFYKNSLSSSAENMAPWILWVTITGLALILLSIVILIVGVLKCRKKGNSSSSSSSDKKTNQEDRLLASAAQRLPLPPDVCGYFVEINEIKQHAIGCSLEGERIRNNYSEYQPINNSCQNSELSFDIGKPLALNDRSKQHCPRRHSPDVASDGSGRQTYNSPIKISKYLTQASPSIVHTKYLPSGTEANETGRSESPPPRPTKSVNIRDYEIGSNSKSKYDSKPTKARNSVDLEVELLHLDKLMHSLDTATNNEHI